ncbi:MAG: transposase family protein [Burkholderiaceae bacterium]|nr:transposase family protein [Burkholderiaceae bacterium]
MQFLGFDHASFAAIVEAAALVLQRPVVPHVGRPHLLDVVDVVALTLRYLGTRGGMDDLQLVFGVTSACVSRELRNGLYALVVALPTVADADIVWPSPATMAVFAQAIRMSDGPPPPDGVFPIGFVDGCALKIPTPADEDAAALHYNGFHKYCCVNNIIAFGPDGCIFYLHLNSPGSFHDSRCAVPLRTFILSDRARRLPPPYTILADAGFRGAHLADMFTTPMVSGEPLPAEAAARAAVLRRNRWVIFRRQSVEWGLRGLQYCFPRIRNPLSCNSLLRECVLLVVARLFNFRTRMLGYNEILAEFSDELLRASDLHVVVPAPVDDEL